MTEIKLNNHIIHEIQEYIGGMDWTQKEYKGEQLQIFLKGVRCALMDTGIRFKLCCETDNNYHLQYYVLVGRYTDPYDCWSEIQRICKIYANKIVTEQEENE